MRQIFDALALYAPDVKTDAQGKASVNLKLPDNLTRYRISAVAVAGYDKYGIGESVITARLPLMVKPSAPRFLNFGDKCELPVVIQNQTDTLLPAEVVVQASNADLISEAAGADSSATSTSATSSAISTSATASAIATHASGYAVDVPAQDRIEVRFPLSTVDVGTARLRMAVASGNAADAATVEFPVKMPASVESFAAYGQIDKDAQVQTVERPANVFPQIGGLNVTTSSTNLQALTDAFFYLKHYEFDCSEQISSRMLAMLSLRDVLFAFNTLEPVDQKSLQECVKRDLDELLKRQNPNGGFGLWKRGEVDEWPYVSVQAARALSLARAKDVAVPPDAIDKAKSYLKDIRKHIQKELPLSAKLSLEAYALYVRSLLGDRDQRAARKVLYATLADKKPDTQVQPLSLDNMRNRLSSESAGWLLCVMTKDPNCSKESAAIRTFIDAKIQETASTASVNSTGYGDFDYCLFYSPRRADAVVLEALIQDQPNHDAIPKLVKGLLGHRKKGKWEGTQENAYVLMALERYFSKYESQTPNFVSQIWLGDTFAGKQDFKGRSTESKSIDIPMSILSQRKDSEELLINKDGAGRLYYRIGLDYAPTNLKLPPTSNGFNVSRTYEAVDDPADVQRLSDGTWKIKPGATVRVKLTFNAPSTRYHVALMDPLPGGFEAINSEMKGNRTLLPPEKEESDLIEDSNNSDDSSGTLPPLPSESLPEPPSLLSSPSTALPPPLPPSLPPPSTAREDSPVPVFCCIPWWLGSWFDHQNLRDHQAEAFTSILWGGSYKYNYLARATTPGTFMVPPPKVEEMYAPETFARGSTDQVIIK